MSCSKARCSRALALGGVSKNRYCTLQGLNISGKVAVIETVIWPLRELSPLGALFPLRPCTDQGRRERRDTRLTQITLITPVTVVTHDNGPITAQITATFPVFNGPEGVCVTKITRPPNGDTRDG
jgi:hypothetical protein